MTRIRGQPEFEPESVKSPLGKTIPSSSKTLRVEVDNFVVGEDAPGVGPEF
jgi:hypothetical protein